MGERSTTLILSVIAAVVGVCVVGSAVLVYVTAQSVQSVQEAAKVDSTRIGMSRVAQRLEIHMLRSGPVTDLNVVFPDGAPTDSWENPYVYEVPGPNDKAFELVSLGADGQRGGTGHNTDILYSEF